MPTHDFIRLHRGQATGSDELKLIQLNVGQFISMNSFLSTSLQHQIALHFLDTIEFSNEIDRILFEIDIDLRQKTITFSNIDHLSYFKNENQVLIIHGALLRTESVNEDKTKKI